jgi:hypothetical protein
MSLSLSAGVWPDACDGAEIWRDIGRYR